MPRTSPAMPLDPQVQAVLDKIRAAGNPGILADDTAAGARLAQSQGGHSRREARAGVQDQRPCPFRAPQARSRADLCSAPASEPCSCLVWLHGGGHVVGSLDSYDALCRQLALQGDCIVVSVAYRLAPEHKFPAGVEDSFAALQWVARTRRRSAEIRTRLAIGGDSAGGNLAAVCAILARDAGRARSGDAGVGLSRTAPDEEFAVAPRVCRRPSAHAQDHPMVSPALSCERCRSAGLPLRAAHSQRPVAIATGLDHRW